MASLPSAPFEPRERRAVYFVVARCQGIETPSIYYDELPRVMPFRVEYVLRLDEQPGAERLLQMDLTRLLKLYQYRKRNGTLPPRWAPPPPRKQGEKPKLLLGHHESSQRAVIERSRAKEA